MKKLNLFVGLLNRLMGVLMIALLLQIVGVLTGGIGLSMPLVEFINSVDKEVLITLGVVVLLVIVFTIYGYSEVISSSDYKPVKHKAANIIGVIVNILCVASIIAGIVYTVIKFGVSTLLYELPIILTITLLVIVLLALILFVSLIIKIARIARYGRIKKEKVKHVKVKKQKKGANVQNNNPAPTETKVEPRFKFNK